MFFVVAPVDNKRTVIVVVHGDDGVDQLALEIGRIGEGGDDASVGESASEGTPRSYVDVGACEQRAYRTRLEEQIDAMALELAGSLSDAPRASLSV